MSRMQQEWAVMAVVFALIAIANGSHLSAVLACVAVIGMLVGGWRQHR